VTAIFSFVGCRLFFGNIGETVNPRPPYSDIPFTQQINSNFGMGGEFNIPRYAYFDNDLYTYGGGPWAQPTYWYGTRHYWTAWWLYHYEHEVIFGRNNISLYIHFVHPHTGVAVWLRDVEVEGSTIIFNINRLDFGGGGAAITDVYISAQVKREHAQNVTQYRIITRDVYSPPIGLTVSIHERYMDRVADEDFTPADFGPLVSEIRFERWERGSMFSNYIVRTIVVHYRSMGGWDGINRLIDHLETLSFVNYRPRAGAGLGSGVGIEIVIPIAPEYNAKFDNEQFSLNDFNHSGILAILRYNHPRTQVWANITLTLAEPSTANLNQLTYHVKNHVSYVEAAEWSGRYRIVYHYI